ncbi:unnamed protein product, partial [Hymenolepis diminuta]
QLLRLTVSLDRSRVLDSEADPHVLTFYRSTKQAGELNRIRRDIRAIVKMEGNITRNLVKEKATSGAKRKKRRRKNRNGKSD